MIEQSIELSDMVDDLLGVLERDYEHIERTALFLNELRCLVIKRDEKGLGLLLESIRSEAQDYSANEQRRGLIRKEMAQMLGCEPAELTLSVLKNAVEGQARNKVAQIQEKLKTVTGRLQAEYAVTVKLISECARINTILLKTVFEKRMSGQVFYDSTGLTKRQGDAAFMSMRL